MRSRVLAWVYVVLWMALIACLSTETFSGSWSEALLRFWAELLHLPIIPGGLGLANLLLRKSAHVSVFFVLGYLLCRALSPDTQRANWGVHARALLVGGAYALLDELHQSFTETRGPSLLDASWDFAGVLISQWLLWRRSKRGRSSPVPGSWGRSGL